MLCLLAEATFKHHRRSRLGPLLHTTYFTNTWKRKVRIGYQNNIFVRKQLSRGEANVILELALFQWFTFLYFLLDLSERYNCSLNDLLPTKFR